MVADRIHTQPHKKYEKEGLKEQSSVERGGDITCEPDTPAASATAA
jgi:hypothetical protein